MIDRQIKAAAAGGLHTAHCARLARRQGPPALTPVEPTTLLGADPPRDDRIYRSTISTVTPRASFALSPERPDQGAPCGRTPPRPLAHRRAVRHRLRRREIPD